MQQNQTVLFSKTKSTYFHTEIMIPPMMHINLIFIYLYYDAYFPIPSHFSPPFPPHTFFLMHFFSPFLSFVSLSDV